MRRPQSLRGRVVVAVLLLLTLLLAALFVAVDLLLAARLHADLRTRLTDRVALAEQLDGALSPQQLADRLRGDGVTVQLCSPEGGGCVTADVPVPATAPAPPGRTPRPPTPPRPAQPSTVQTVGSLLVVHTTLPQSGQVLTLAVDDSQVGTAVSRLVVLEVVGGAVTLAVAGALLVLVIGRALRPLDRMTELARSIAGGDRGRRLDTGRPDTELGRTAQAFDEMLDELESAEARMRRLLRDVSHELRTPLAGLQATAETLLRGEPDRDGREGAYVELIRETRRASRLVEDLLTMARLDGGMPLARERVDLADVLAQEIERLHRVAPEVTVSADTRTAVVHADPLRLGQIIANLLTNARYAASAVRIGLHRTEDGWQLDVADDGSGVAPADAERIFQPLVRLDQSRSRHSGGFGLGLPIARALARAHGGDLFLVPGPGGARFRLLLPAADPVQPAREVPATAGTP